jgi:TonB family protein
MSIVTRFLNVFRSSALERELDDEVRFHLDQQVARSLRRGMDEDEANAAARRQFGDVAQAKSEMREARMMNRKVVGAFALGVTLGALSGVLSVGLIWRAKPVPATAAVPAPAFYRVGQEGTSFPKLLHEAKPNYTAEAMLAKIQGTVLMECVVQPDGVCNSVRVTRSLEPGLDREAMNALQSWRFEPGRREGKPVPVLVTIEMAFTLRS